MLHSEGSYLARSEYHFGQRRQQSGQVVLRQIGKTIAELQLSWETDKTEIETDCLRPRSIVTPRSFQIDQRLHHYQLQLSKESAVDSNM